MTEPRDKVPRPLGVVGVGASAGGLQALFALFEHLPADTGLAYILIQHQAPDQGPLLAELLVSRTAMSVAEVVEGMLLGPNSVYVVPPGREVGIRGRRLSVRLNPAAQSAYHPIDHLFCALATELKSQSIGVILSGNGDDGTRGLKAIRAEGGLTYVQSELSADYRSMPATAIHADVVDKALQPRDIARELVSLSQHLHGSPSLDVVTADATDSLNRIFHLLKHHTGHDFSHYKRSTINRRIHRRVVLHRLNSLDQYVHYLKKDRAELEQLFDDVLINVTSFFRDEETYEAIKTQVLTRLEGLGPEEPIRVWVAGCSTGEEPYSVAMVMMEYFGDQWMQRPIQIFATDIDSKALRRARAGVYTEGALEAVSPQRRQRFFTKVAGGYQISKSVRDLCVFAEQDLLKDPPFSRIDLICCRNLMIYLDNSLQKKVLSIFHFALKRNGMLVLGTSESVSSSADLFVPVDKKNKIYVRRSVHLRPNYDFSDAARASTPKELKTVEHNLAPRSAQKEAEQYLLNHYGPPSVIIDQATDIVGFLGHVAPFIEPMAGAISLKLLKMTRRDLATELRALVMAAVKDNIAAFRELVRYRNNEQECFVNIRVVPLQRPDSVERYFLVSFEPAVAPAPLMQVPGDASASYSESEKDARIRRLEFELMALRQEMQSVINEQVTTNEELQAANEEIQSANEELQSTNEELESAKEELQSTNEELATVNDELEARNQDLALANNDLLNLLNGVSLPMLILDADARIRQFTPMAKPLLNLIDSDIGRPLSDLRPNIDIPGLNNTIHKVIAQVEPQLVEAREHGNRWYSISIRPYKTLDNRIAGAVLVFIDVTELRPLTQHAKRLAAVLKDSRDAVSLLDADGRILAWNQSAEMIYGYSEEEALKLRVFDLVPPPLREEMDVLLQRLFKGELVPPVRTQRVTKGGRTREVLLTISPLRDAQGEVSLLATTERDVTPG